MAPNPTPSPRLTRRRLLTGGAAIVGVAALTTGFTRFSNIPSAGSRSGQLTLVGYSTPQAADQAIASAWSKTPGGKGVTLGTSFGASGQQSRNVANGLPADFVHLSLSSDVTKLVTAGLVPKSWNADSYKGVVSTTAVVLAVRPGNPLGIKGWDDLARPGVKIVTPDPNSSGSARWNILAAWAHVGGAGGRDTEAENFLSKVLKNTVSLPGSGRDATTAFTSGTGDVLISYECEAIAARAKNPGSMEYLVPDDTLLIENPGAVLTHATSANVGSWLNYLHSDAGQAIFAQYGFRPMSGPKPTGVVGANDPHNPFPQPKKMYRVSKDFGSWSDVNQKFFSATGLVTKIFGKQG